MLPGESEVSLEIEKALKIDLLVGEKFLAMAVSILTERHPKTAPGSDEEFSYRLGHGLCFKACKLYRSILHLAKIGAGHDIDILIRSQYETTLAALFVLKDKVTFGLTGFPDEQLTSELRAKIYLAHNSIKSYKRLLRLLNDPRFAPVLASVDKEHYRKEAELAEQAVGPFWAERLNNKNTNKTYSGLDLRSLAGKVDKDFENIYENYKLQSEKVHASDGWSHIKFNSTEQRHLPKWHSSADQIRTLLVQSGLFLFRALDELHRRFNFSDNLKDNIDTKTELEMAVVLFGTIHNTPA